MNPCNSRKSTICLLTLLITIAVTTLHNCEAQSLHDEFSGSSIDFGLWQPSTPFADSAVSVGGGNAIFENRGGILSVQSFVEPLDITGRFNFVGNSSDSFRLITRTDGAAILGSGEFGGIAASINIRNGDGNNLPGNIALLRQDTSGLHGLAWGSFSIAVGTFYDFRLTDDGNNVALYINDLNTPLITAIDSSVLGDQIAIYNREGAGGGSSISAGSLMHLDFVNVVPEPSSVTLLACGLVGVIWLRRKGQRERPTI